MSAVLSDRKRRMKSRTRGKGHGVGAVRVKLRFKLSKPAARAIGKRYRLALRVTAEGGGTRVVRTFSAAR